MKNKNKNKTNPPKDQERTTRSQNSINHPEDTPNTHTEIFLKDFRDLLQILITDLVISYIIFHLISIHSILFHPFIRPPCQYFEHPLNVGNILHNRHNMQEAQYCEKTEEMGQLNMVISVTTEESRVCGNSSDMDVL